MTRFAFFKLFACVLALVCYSVGYAENSSPEVDLDYYPSDSGTKFFMLSDKSFGSQDIATVRVEAGGRRFWGDDPSGQINNGIDIYVYKIKDPVAFLKGQPNLHRINVKANYQGEGLSNALTQLWKSWNVKSRRSWQSILDADARSRAVTQAPELSVSGDLLTPAKFEATPQYAPLPQFPLVDRFRYPLWQAKPSNPVQGVTLEGSSSEFLETSPGNIMVPLGKLSPGLYLVEAMIGKQRAHTLVFVSDTLVITKNAKQGMWVWASNRTTGGAVPRTQVVWTDGVGELQRATTDDQGVVNLDRLKALSQNSPERSYVYGVDDQGGVFISENFYYDSEIYNTKLYTITDRPLYRPGDDVNLKIWGREFLNARDSQAAKSADISLKLLDPNGQMIDSKTVKFDSILGADGVFNLSSLAQSGGYSILFEYQGDKYMAAFRVANYIKPHFETSLVFDQPSFKVGDAINGQILLVYPNGQPVANATVSMTVRGQQVSMVSGEFRYAGLFPVKVSATSLKTDSHGQVRFTLPAAEQPSRYIINIDAVDSAEQYVRYTRELLIERGVNAYTLNTSKNFTQPKESVHFDIKPVGLVQEGASPPSSWEWIRLESRAKQQGAITNGNAFDITFAEPGSYSIFVRDQQGNLLGASSHWVAGNGLVAAPGSIEMVFDKPQYTIGDEAHVLITFPDVVQEAMLTLERDDVSAFALLSQGADWISLKKISDKQWSGTIKVSHAYAPNMTFSVVYVYNGTYLFQNSGLVVKQPSIDVVANTERPRYAPGDLVTVTINTQFANQGIPANVAISVVDESVYLLQPEIAPHMVDFFYHPRRNNIRTSSSLNFVNYDASSNRMTSLVPQYQQRGIKILERPRRDDKDTALWNAQVMTDAHGKATVTFVMPDALTRWRITARAMSTDGKVGQSTSYVQSHKDAYIKWLGSQTYRQGDKPQLDALVFNQTDHDIKEAVISIDGILGKQDITMPLVRGVNVLHLPQAPLTPGDINLAVSVNGQLVDRLAIPIQVASNQLTQTRQMIVGPETANLNLPKDATNLRLTWLDGSQSSFLSLANDLIVGTGGGAESSANRMISLVLAYQGVQKTASDPNLVVELQRYIRSERDRLASLAGVGGTFGWWGATSTKDSFLLTTYAYYADWMATQSLGLNLPASHWEYLLQLYSKEVNQRGVTVASTIGLWMMQDMGLPVKSLIAGQQARLLSKPISFNSLAPMSGVMFDVAMNAQKDSTQALQLILLEDMMVKAKIPVMADEQGQINQARDLLSGSNVLSIRAALSLQNPELALDALLTDTAQNMPDFDKGMSLIWLRRGLQLRDNAPLPRLDAGWKLGHDLSGQPYWTWAGKALATNIVLPSDNTGRFLLSYETSDALLTERVSPWSATTNRQFMRVDTNSKGGVSLSPVALGDLETNTLYLMEIKNVPVDGERNPGALASYGFWNSVVVPMPSNFELLDTALLSSEKQALLQNTPSPVLSEGGMMIALNSEASSRSLYAFVRFRQPGTFSVPPISIIARDQHGFVDIENQGRPTQITIK